MIRIAFALTVSMPLAGQGYLNVLEVNKKVVFDFYRLVIEPRNPDLAEIYVAADFLDHDPVDQKGTESVARLVAGPGPASSGDIGSTLRNPPAFIMAEGDQVTWVFKQNLPDSKNSSMRTEQLVLEIYRIRDRKIVERWKGVAKLP